MVYFDTLHYVKALKKVGFSEEQAETFARVQKESLSECLDTTLATKADLQDVKSTIQKLEARVHVLEWMQGATLAGIAAILVKLFL